MFNSNLLIQIKAKLEDLQSQKSWKLVLNSWLRTQLTYTSNSIEGNTLSLIETSIIINDNQGVAGKSLREINEAKNHAAAWDFIQQELVGKESENLNQNDLLNIHSLILKNIDDLNAGKYRNIGVRIAGSQSLFPNPLKVTNLMDETFSWLVKSNFEEVESVLKVAILSHLKIVKIHPFTDGNGRTVRLFMNTILMQNKLPPIDILPEKRKEYLETLENSDIHNPDLFFNFMFQTYSENLENYLKTFNN